MIEWLIIAFIWILNFIICSYNAITFGMVWKHDDYLSTWMKLVLWSALIMSAAGFTWCYTIFVVMLAGALNYISPAYVEIALNLGYLIVIFPILLSGLVIWVHSLVEAYKRRDLRSVGVAGWNTFANIYNWYNAFRMIPQSLKSVGKLFEGGGNSKEKGAMIVIVLVIISLCMGIITTYSLVKYGEKMDR